MSRLAIVGHRDAVLPFKALGVTVCPVAGPAAALAAVKECVDAGYGIVFLTETLAQNLEAELSLLTSAASTVVTVIPDQLGSSGVGMARLKQRVEKAIGVDILFKEEGR
jgi:V/A-type H+-transporting ATPase subunit F